MINRNLNRIILLVSLLAGVQALPGSDKYLEDRSSRAKIFDITDRAAGIHNAGNIGLFFENRGKLYPRRLSDGPSGEYPINSGRHYIWRINPKFGVAAQDGLPVNVIQAHFTQNEEWEAVGGYHNPDYAKIAFSDNSITWPENGWPVKDKDGNAMILSDQDSYCVYDDAENSLTELGIQVIQRGFAYGVSFARDILFFRYEIINNGPYDLDSTYFSLYSDIDIGYVSGNSEWEDDYFGIEKDLNSLYMYDYDNYSAEWGGATGYFGVAMLKTPEINGEEGGLTGVHWNGYYYDIDDDSLMFAIMSSDLNYLPDKYAQDQYFHFSTDPYFDDPDLIKEGGEDIVGWANSGPYTLNRGDTLTFHTAIIGGIDFENYMDNLESAFTVVQKDYSLPKPPPSPVLTALPGDGKVILSWSNDSEEKLDEFSGEYDFEGYRIYRSLDKGIHWDPVDRNINPLAGANPIPLVDMDIVNGIGDDTGVSYSFIDTDVKNGFEYWYTITAYDRGTEVIEQLESSIGNTLDAPNTVSVIPVSTPSGTVASALDEVVYTGTSSTNYTVEILSVAPNLVFTDPYEISFSYVIKNEFGDLKTETELIISDSSAVRPHKFGIEFLPDNRFQAWNLTLGETIDRSTTYTTTVSRKLDGSNMKVSFHDPDTLYLPEPGDMITVSFAATVRKGDGIVLDQRPWEVGKNYATSDGLVFRIIPEYMGEVVTSGTEPPVTADLFIDDIDALLDTTLVLSFSQLDIDDGDLFTVLTPYMDSLGNLVSVGVPDTLYDGSYFSVYGLGGSIAFEDGADINETTIISVRTYSENPLSLLDRFEFTMKDAIFSEDKLKMDTEETSIKVVPNPYMVSSLWEPEFGELAYEPIRQIQFINLPPECDIHVFTIAGDLIKTLNHSNGTGTEAWDLRAAGGRELAPGIYLYVVKSGSFEFMNRFAVIK